MASAAGPTLYLIDGHAQFFRAYHAIRTSMSSPVTGEPTNLTFGFVGMLIKVLRDYRPDYLAVTIDRAGDRETFRSELYPEYKANREPPPDDFRPQVERCLAVLDQLGIPVVAEDGVEADDVIASVVGRLLAEHADLRIRIVSKDKDLAQLLSDRVSMFDVHKDEEIDVATLFKSKGVRPGQVIDMLALMGDTVDNVPGVKGIGPKTAAQLIEQYQSLDNLLEHLDEIKGKRRENLEAARDTLALSRQLVTLRDDLDVPFDLEASRIDPRSLPFDELEATLRQLGFKRHIDDLRQLASRAGVANTRPNPDASTSDPAQPPRAASRLHEQEPRAATLPTTAHPSPPDGARPSPPPADSLFAHLDPEPEPEAARGVYDCITTAADLEALVERIRSTGAVAVDTETDSTFAMRAELCGISLATEPGAAVYVPVRSPEQTHHLDTTAALDRLRSVLEDPAISKTGHNLKYDIIVLRRHGIRLRGVEFDTMIASYVVDATRSSHALDVLGMALLDYRSIPLADLIGSGRRQAAFSEVPLAQATDYAAEDADLALRVRAVLEPQLEQLGLRTLFDDLEMPLVQVLAALEYHGIRVDPQELDRQRERLGEQIDVLRRQIIDAAPHHFNPDSPKQLAAVLFNKPHDDPPGLGLRPTRHGKTGPSTDQEVLERLATDLAIESPVPRLILDHRQLTKLVGTYLVALKDAIHPETGRVHASFNQTVAATGRLSSSDPNLQNIPIRTEVGREIRRAFVAEPGHVLIAADYSQIELRLLAHLAGDPALIEAFHEDIDIHTAVAAEVHGVEPAAVTAEQRNGAKMVNFGIVYGITAYGLARRLGPDVPVEHARKIIADYKRRFSRIESFLDTCVSKALTDGYVETMLGRRRNIPQVHSRNQQQRSLGERMAINTVVQGSAADLIKLAMIDLDRAMPGRWPDVRLLLQIHDELVLESPEAVADEVRDFVVQRMEQAMKLEVPLRVESACSTCWIDVK